MRLSAPTHNDTSEIDPLLENALKLAAEGVAVFPTFRAENDVCNCPKGDECDSPGKHPRIKNGSAQASMDPGQIKAWWAKYKGLMNFGQTLRGRAVVDIDVAEGKQGPQQWEELTEEHDSDDIPPSLEYRTGRGGRQIVYRLPEGEEGGRESGGYGNKLAPHIDFKTGPHAYVMVPGSRTVDVYTITVDEPPQLLPDWIAEQARSYRIGKKPGDGSSVTFTGRTVLSELLAVPGEERGNDWLTALCGHFAKREVHKDAYVALVQAIDSWSVQQGGAIAEAQMKTINSIWEAEQRKGWTADENNGFLFPGDNCLMVTCKVQVETEDENGKKSKESEFIDMMYADFDIKVIGLIDQESRGARAYDVHVLRKRDGAILPRVLEHATLSDPRKLQEWLASAGVTVAKPQGAMGPDSMTTSVRLTRYLEAQNGKPSTVLDQVGWQPDLQLFLTPEGIIRPGGNQLEPFEGIRPVPNISASGDAPFEYGFAEGGVDELREIVAEVLTFHDETALGVYMSWALMTLVKSEIKQRVSQFPICTVQAASGSGKTSGAFKMIGELCGASVGEMQTSVPDLRSKLSSFRSGFIHVDDLDDPRGLTELIRLATGEGTKTLRDVATGYRSTKKAKLTGTMLMTGEALGFGDQKALLDRTIPLTLPDPSGRKSLKPGREHVAQYEDVLDLWKRYPSALGGLTALSGTLVAWILTQVTEVRDTIAKEKPKAGRDGDKYAVVLTGARVLDRLLATDNHWYDVVAAWVRDQIDTGSKDWDNTLTLQVLPWAIRQFEHEDDLRFKGTDLKDWPAVARNCVGERDLMQEPIVMFHPRALETAWRLHMGGRVEKRVHTQTAFVEQAKAAGFYNKTTRPAQGCAPVRMWCIEGDAALMLFERSRG